ncbi:MAG: DNA-deoxyinosine glycosylase [Eubacteriales bacterium]|nr:DNA-deoxyinosine glycosylase [Eubacteriales bacterium]
MPQEYQRLTHQFPPIYDQTSKILILGTFPSVKSREQNFYYGHPRNRFWRVLAEITGEGKAPETVEEKKVFLYRNHIAVWDVIEACEIIGSSDSSIRNVVPAPIGKILAHAPIRQVYANGQKAFELYQKYTLPKLRQDNVAKEVLEVAEGIQKLPSTSPANAAWQMERLLAAWGALKETLG